VCSKKGITLVSMDQKTGPVLQGNAYWAGGSSFKVKAGGSTYSSLSSWRSGTGQERNGSTNTGLFADPKLSERADSVVTADSAFDGTRSITYVVKDADGRLFEVSTVISDARDGSRVGRHGAPPSFGDTRYFMLMNDKGVDWAIKSFGRKPSTRHAQILQYKNDPSFPDSVRDLGQRTIDGTSRTVIHFNSSVFLVSADGFEDACKREGVRRCADAWQRIDNGEDPFDAR
jgi:hypothetical protein